MQRYDTTIIKERERPRRRDPKMQSGEWARMTKEGNGLSAQEGKDEAAPEDEDG